MICCFGIGGCLCVLLPGWFTWFAVVVCDSVLTCWVYLYLMLLFGDVVFIVIVLCYFFVFFAYVVLIILF